MTWGVLNQFLEEKGTTAAESHRYNSASSILVNLPTSGRSGSPVIPNYTYYMDEDVEVEFLVHDFSVFPIRKARLDWTLDSEGEILAEGSLDSVDIRPFFAFRVWTNNNTSRATLSVLQSGIDRSSRGGRKDP